MSAYYNEFDPKAAAWLRELIADGLIAPGEVDERDIRDVRPAELAGFRQVHLFAGIGGWSAALRKAGWPDEMPVWTASCPCQPFSAAGGRSGFADERHLWPAVYHLATQCRPAVLLGEQSSSKDGLAWLDLVSADMEAAGYAGGALDLCSAGFGAPNIRQRLYFAWLADAMRPGRAEGRAFAGNGQTALGGESGRVADATSCRGGAGLCDHGPRPERRLVPTDGSGVVRLVHADGKRGCGGQFRREDAADARLASQAGGLADTDGGNASAEGLQRGREHGQRAQDGRAGRMGDAGGARAGRDAGGPSEAQAGSRGARLANGNDCGFPSVASSPNGRPGPVNGFWRAADWLGCTDGVWRPAAPGTFPLVTGLPGRVALLRGAGNAINLEVAAGFVEAVMDCAVAERLAA